MNFTNRNKTPLPNAANEFESAYVDLRIAEKRMYSDEEVAWLPEVDEEHVHKKEWDIRKSSCTKLIRYLGNKRRPLKILEVGCGNGWLSYQLSQIPDSNVTGLDINLIELQQAERVFAGIPNLGFIYNDLASVSIGFKEFDAVVFAASIQYFHSFKDIIETVLDKLNNKGEIHLLDSHFYFETEVEEARQRSHEYFLARGFDCMDKFYFHHSLKELDGFKYSILYNPHSIVNKVLRKRNPFYWICIKK
jgi:SAM-dependent methyltransferase